MNPEIKLTRNAATTVYISSKEASYGIFCFNQVGDLFLNSDYGLYGFAWRSYGEDFEKFLAQTNAEYVVGKFEINFNEVTGKRSIPAFRKEKVTILVREFIEHLKTYKPAPVESV